MDFTSQKFAFTVLIEPSTITDVKFQVHIDVYLQDNLSEQTAQKDPSKQCLPFRFLMSNSCQRHLSHIKTCIELPKAEATPCISRDYGNGGTVCVCNGTYCDSTPEYEVPDVGSYIRYTSSEDGLPLSMTQGVFDDENTSADIILRLEPDITYQRIHGFGGAMTDSAAINIKSLSEGAQENVLRSYFGEEGSKYNLVRVPIAGTDYSIRIYTYDDYDGDVSLEKFSLADEDLIYKIPLMQKALELNPRLRFFAASWTAPSWMKTNDYYLCQDGFLLEEYYQVYADYIIKFMDEYKEHGLEMWAISTGNEPVNGILPESIYNCMAWTPQGIANWVAENLGPTISRSNHSETLIFTLDDQRSRLSWFVEEMFENELAKNYTAGIAVHWYFDQMSSTNLLDETHSNYSDKFLLLTEAAIWNATADTYVSLGCWDRAEQYILDIIENLEHWVTGWVDWNLALDIDSGPAWDNNTLDASIVVNADEDEFYKQPMFYAVAHFSKFIPRESVRVELSMSQDETSVKSVAFKTPENETVLVIYNMSTEEQQVTVSDPERGNFTLQLPYKSIQTILYK